MKRSKISIVLAAAVILAVVGISGFILGRTQSAGTKTADKSATSKSTSKSFDNSDNNNEKAKTESSTRTITLYFTDSNAQYLVPEKQEISGVNGADIYRLALECV